MKTIQNLKRRIIRKIDSSLNFHKHIAKVRAWLLIEKHKRTGDYNSDVVWICDKALDIIEDARFGESFDELEDHVRSREKLAKDICDLARHNYVDDESIDENHMKIYEEAAKVLEKHLTEMQFVDKSLARKIRDAHKYYEDDGFLDIESDLN